MGSGTDPGEGAALAGALLDRLADTAGLTYATTHHAQLKERPVSNPTPRTASPPSPQTILTNLHANLGQVGHMLHEVLNCNIA